jgi:hypothetical protein
MSSFRTSLAALAVAILSVACSSDDDDGAEVTFTNDIHPILQAKCGTSGCHDGSQAPTLPGHGAADVQEAYEATQSMSLGEPVYERILARVTDEDAMMPPSFASPPCQGEIGTPGCLTQAEVDLIAAWIEAGTPQ